uniref:Versican core protein n=1 Tax=Magallana gigas TaxID=29159 RepID=K1QI49_MAGGI
MTMGTPLGVAGRQGQSASLSVMHYRQRRLIVGPCQNGGTCLDLINKYECQCVPGYTGTQCEIDINECASNPCENQATCNNYVNFFNCTCLPGFTGYRCQKGIKILLKTKINNFE